MKINWKVLESDFFGGLSAAAVALPLAVAYGAHAGLGSLSGVYSSILFGFMIALIGGTPILIGGPSVPTTLVCANIVNDAIRAYGSMELALPEISLTIILSGILQILFGYYKSGYYIRYLPYPVVSGFISGASIVIMIVQIPLLLGHDTYSSAITVLIRMPELAFNTNLDALILGILTILVVYGLPKLTIKIPSTIAAIFLLSTFAWINQSPAPVFEAPGQFQNFKLASIIPEIDQIDLSRILFGAIGLAFVSSINSLLTTTILANLSRCHHDVNRDLLAIGCGNMLAPLLGGMPGSGTTIPSLVGLSSGSKTRISSVVYSLSFIGFMIWTGFLFNHLPKSVIAGILITVGISSVDFNGLRQIKNLPTIDALVLLTVLLGSVFHSMLFGIMLGISISCLYFIVKMGDISDNQTKQYPLTEYLKKHNSSVILPGHIARDTLCIRIYGPLFFGFSSKFMKTIKSAPDCKTMVLRMEMVPYLDHSGMIALQDSVTYLKSRNIRLVMTELQTQPLSMLEKALFIPKFIEKSDVYENVDEFIQSFQTSN